MQQRLDIISVLDEQLLKSYAVSQSDELAQQIQLARNASKIWAATPIKQRLAILCKLSQIILDDIEAITLTVMQVTGKVKTEVLLGEIYPVLALLRFYQQHAAEILAPKAMFTSPLAFPNATAGFTRYPYGVVAVISPWNFPLQLTLSPLLSALICGNGIIFKTSELSVPVGELILALLQKLALPEGLVQQAIGDATTGQQLIEQRPDLLFFTGGIRGGRAVMAQAAQHPIPVILELGGKDAMLVLEDANLERACNAALYGAFSNSGQVCVSVERLYVHQNCYAKLLQLLLEGVAKITVGHGAQGDLGALTSLAQYQTVAAHYHDALAKGAKASGPLELDGRYLKPVVLWDVTHEMRVMQEETFGALLPVMAVRSEAEAIALANASEYGLNASVWSRNIAQAKHVAAQLHVGNWAINDVIKNIGHAGLPFGGTKMSGFGRYRGAEGLHNFSYTVSGLTSHSQLTQEPNWFPYSEAGFQHMLGYIDFNFGSGNLWQRIRRNLPALQAFRGYAQSNMKQHTQNILIWLGIQRDY